MLAGVLMYCEEAEGSWPVECKGERLPWIPYTFDSAKVEAGESAQYVTQTFDFI